jgi:peptidylprolyl isomerase
MNKLLPLAALALLAPMAHAPAVLAQASANLAAGKTQPSPLAPSEIVAAAPKGDWVAIPASDLLVMDLAPDAKGKPRRVVIQLMPAPFSQGWIGNIRKLAAAKFWDGTSVNRVQDNYVVQWGDANGEDTAKAKPLPEGLAVMLESDYVAPLNDPSNEGSIVEQAKMSPLVATPIGFMIDPYVASGAIFNTGTAGFISGWPVAYRVDDELPERGPVNGRIGYVWPVHCYGMVGVGRDLSPNTGTGAELYVVIGHAPRHLDRNIAMVGRVVEGIEHLSSLPRGTGGLGFYETAEERTGITAIRLGGEVPGLPTYEYLSTESASFAKYADARANRRDAFFIRPAGGADICNIPVPVRRSTGSR